MNKRITVIINAQTNERTEKMKEWQNEQLNK